MPNKVNKTKLVREILQTNPHAKPREIVNALAVKGVKISAPVVSQIKIKLRSKGDQSVIDTVPIPRPASNNLDLAVGFIHQVGGIDRAKQILDTLASAVKV